MEAVRVPATVWRAVPGARPGACGYAAVRRSTTSDGPSGAARPHCRAPPSPAAPYRARSAPGALRRWAREIELRDLDGQPAADRNDDRMERAGAPAHCLAGSRARAEESAKSR
ncbi:hypothetical protein GCM10010515_41420 [Streptomyces fructofermentans]|uniref:Uncharacterized protein n=1 Tax=Streptomyces fructofermentans TaxID=152141 RepID=A0A918KN58_9ACTN|nr:hypothetical protein GCM10010515_41420 [Streptomyces fructofermentans]